MTATPPPGRLRAAALSTVLVLSVLAGCGSGGEEVPAAAPPPTSATSPAETTTTSFQGLDPDSTWTATPNKQGDQPVYESPTDDAEVSHTFPNPWLGDSPLVYLVDEQVDADWYKVYLPTRPNGSTGFVKAADVDIFEMPYRIEIRLSEFRLVAYEGDTVLLDTTVAVAADNTPTPTNLYYLTELRGPFPPTDAYGTYAYGLSGFSEVHLPGGDFETGQLGIHGTNQPELIGQQVSNGCIRMRNEDIEKLVPILPLGVPVDVIA